MDDMTNLVSSTWVQTGELGIAFVLVFALLFFVRDILKKSAVREEKLMEFVFAIQPTLENIAMRLADLEDQFKASQHKRDRWEPED